MSCARRSCSSSRARARSIWWRRISRTTGATGATARRSPSCSTSLLEGTAIPWIRLLYLYPTGITPKLLDVMSREPRVLPYLDMPIQHGSDAVLARMRRPERAHTIRERVARLRATVPDVAIRTTCIVGFPGETESDFAQLLRDPRGGALRARRRVHVLAAGGHQRRAARGRCSDAREARPTRAPHRAAARDHGRALRAAHRSARARHHRPRRTRSPARRSAAPSGRPTTSTGSRAFAEAPRRARSSTAIIEDVVDDYDFVARIVGVHEAPAAVAPAVRASRSLPVMAGAATASYGR